MRDAFLLLACLMSGLLCAQTVKPLDDAKLKRQQFEFRKNMPAYAEQLVADLISSCLVTLSSEKAIGPIG